MTQQICPQYVNMPKPGKSYGSVKLANGNKFVGKPEVLGMMEKGKTYDIETQEQQWTDGVVHVIVKATLANGAAHQSQQPPEQFKKQPTPDIDAERMFTTACVTAYIGTEHFMGNATKAGFTETLRHAVIAARLVWQEEIKAK